VYFPAYLGATTLKKDFTDSNLKLKLVIDAQNKKVKYKRLHSTRRLEGINIHGSKFEEISQPLSHLSSLD
jgi:hypothetical protein